MPSAKRMIVNYKEPMKKQVAIKRLTSMNGQRGSKMLNIFTMPPNYNKPMKKQVPSERSAQKNDQRGSKNYLTGLPELCLLSVMKHLTRNDISKVTMVNRRMMPLSDDPSLESIKWRGGDLNILQTAKGYGFALKISTNEDPEASQTIFQYEIIKDEDGAFEERRVINGSLKFDSLTPPHNWLIPDQFFIALKEILRHHQAKDVRFSQIPFDGGFFNRLRTALNGHRTSYLYCWRMTCKKMTDDDRLSFAHFIKGVSRVDLQATRHIAALVNERFLGELVKADQLHKFTNDLDLTYVYKHRFLLDESLLPRLCNRFSNFYAEGMVVSANWIGQIISLRMEAASPSNPESLGEWKFTVDQPVTYQLLAQQFPAPDYEHFGQDVTYYIYCKRNDMTAYFLFSFINVDKGRAFMQQIEVHFHFSKPYALRDNY